jgi:hypothetical protein
VEAPAQRCGLSDGDEFRRWFPVCTYRSTALEEIDTSATYTFDVFSSLDGYGTGLDPIFQDAADFDLDLVESRTLDGHIQELVYRPTLH